MKNAFISFAVLLALGLALPVLAEDGGGFQNPKAVIPPQASQNRISGGESFPPLPLPATPVRRTERKREPAPPALIGKINLNIIDGKQISAYPSVTLDIENLMNWTNAQLKLRYRYIETDLSKFSFQPTELPVLYITGWTPLPEFSEAVKEKLREYLMAGGTLIVHANCGRPEFNESFIKLQKELFPDRPMGWLPPDHPVYSCLHRIEQMRFRENDGPWMSTDKDQKHMLMGMNIGCRAAIIFSPVDVSWGWDANKKPIIGGRLFDQGDSLKLGSNILTYVLTNYEYARVFELTKIYHQADLATRDQLVVAQLMHNGDWDPTPHGLPNLLKFIDSNSTLNVQFKRQTVNLDDLDVYKNPLLYMTGLRAFALTDKEQKRLSDYLHAGGVIFAEAAMGSETFDKSFRSAILKIIPDAKFELLKPDHPIYSNVFKVGQVKYSPLVASVEPNLRHPQLEAVMKDGVPVVIFSHWSLSNGWEQLPNAYAKGYSDEDSLKLGANILVYTLTH
ncbi:MAG: DUF4159 domain-containing protein [Phycisphaerales bacterium]|nr:DUF4159 domain-containing protein [Phycisphaerales bacterium]